MSTVSIHIEGHEDGSIDDYSDLAVVLLHIADQMMNEQPALWDNQIPADVLMPYGGWSDHDDEDEDELATWSVQYSRY
jgi:hypothetical protein